MTNWTSLYLPPTPRHGTWVPYLPSVPPTRELAIYPSTCYWPVVVVTGDLFKLVHFRTYPHPVLVPSDGHWKTYGWQAGSTHPVGMLSCFDLYFLTLLYRSGPRFSHMYRMTFSTSKGDDQRSICSSFVIVISLFFFWNNILIQKLDLCHLWLNTEVKVKIMSDHEVGNFFPNLLSRIITLHHRVRLKKAGHVISSNEMKTMPCIKTD